MKGRILHSVIVAPPGTGSDRDKRISDEGRKALLVALREDLDLKRGLSRDVFINEYCAPMRKQETWLSWIHKTYGAIAARPATERVGQYLRSSKARIQILACMRAGVPLHGLSEEQPGIEHCRVLVKDLDEAKSKPSANAVPAAQATSSGTMVSNAFAATGSAQDTPMTTVGTEAVEDADPLLVRARSRTEASLERLQVHDDLASLRAGFAAQVMSDEKVVFWLDAVTSKPKVLNRMMDNLANFLTDVNVKRQCTLIPCGRRLDLVVIVTNKASVVMPTANCYTVQLCSSKTQTAKRRPAYCVVIVTKLFMEADSMPNVLTVTKRANSRECTRLRCLNKHCPLRSPEELASLNASMDAEADPSQAPVAVEIDPDDQDVAADDDEVEEAVDDEAAPGDEEMDPVPPPAADVRCVQELWPFAFPKDRAS